MGGKAVIATSVPVTINADAAEYADRLGFRPAMDQIVEHVVQTIPH